jgi:hypothetical protein
MSKGFIFATTSNIDFIIEVANSVAADLVQVEDGINCYSGNDGILMSEIIESELDPIGDFRESLDLFNNCPVLIPIENFNVFYGQLVGDICFANRLFVNLENLMIMINYPKIIFYKNVAPAVAKDISYDWYLDEDKVSSIPDLYLK